MQQVKSLSALVMNSHRLNFRECLQESNDRRQLSSDVAVRTFFIDKRELLEKFAYITYYFVP